MKCVAKFLLISILLFCVVASTFNGAVVYGHDIHVPSGGVQLGYNNGTYITLPEGTYDSVYRVDNQWYVNDQPFPFSGLYYTGMANMSFWGSSTYPTPTPPPPPFTVSIGRLFGNIWVVLALMTIIPIILGGSIIFLFLRSEGEIDTTEVVVIAASLSAYYIVLYVAIIVTSGVQSAF